MGLKLVFFKHSFRVLSHYAASCVERMSEKKCSALPGTFVEAERSVSFFCIDVIIRNLRLAHIFVKTSRSKKKTTLEMGQNCERVIQIIGLIHLKAWVRFQGLAKIQAGQVRCSMNHWL